MLRCAVTNMKFAILGATGPTGQLLVQECLDQGHEVTALVRSPEKLTVSHDKLNVEKVDILKKEDLVPHMRGCDAIFSVIGFRGNFWSACSIYSDSMKVTTAAMKEAGVSRVIAMSSWGTKYDANQYWVVKYLLRHVFLKNVLKDMGAMEDHLSSTDLDFTVARTAQLTTSKASGKEVKVVEGQFAPDVGMTIDRHDVAKFFLKCAVEGEWKKKHISIGVK